MVFKDSTTSQNLNPDDLASPQLSHRLLVLHPYLLRKRLYKRFWLHLRGMNSAPDSGSIQGWDAQCANLRCACLTGGEGCRMSGRMPCMGWWPYFLPVGFLKKPRFALPVVPARPFRCSVRLPPAHVSSFLPYRLRPYRSQILMKPLLVTSAFRQLGIWQRYAITQPSISIHTPFPESGGRPGR